MHRPSRARRRDSAHAPRRGHARSGRIGAGGAAPGRGRREAGDRRQRHRRRPRAPRRGGAGARGRDGLANQVAQDSNASRLGVESCSSRIVAKGGALYTNASWDLVDATLSADFDWNAVPLADLPQELQSMTREQQVAARIAYFEAPRTYLFTTYATVFSRILNWKAVAYAG